MAIRDKTAVLLYLDSVWKFGHRFFHYLIGPRMHPNSWPKRNRQEPKRQQQGEPTSFSESFRSELNDCSVFNPKPTTDDFLICKGSFLYLDFVTYCDKKPPVIFFTIAISFVKMPFKNPNFQLCHLILC